LHRHPDHIQDAGDASLIEGMDVEPAANQIGSDVGLEIGECQNEVGLQRQDLVDVRRGEGTHARLFPARLWWAHDIAGDPDDAVLLAEQIQRLDGLFGEADNSTRRKHSTFRGLFYLQLFTKSSMSAPSVSAMR